MNHNLFKPTYLKELCQEYDLIPSKKYGQNYLISDVPIKKMLESADVKKTDTIVEIGPGFGVLTFALAEKANKVVAFEIERKLEKYWEEVAPKNVEVVWGNALKEFVYRSQEFGKYKVLANLPYQITSNVLRIILETENKPESVTVMVQKEVAERIVAKPGDMSILAVSVQYYGVPKIVCKTSSGSFWPSPKVDSAVLHIRLSTIDCRTSDFDQMFFKVVRAGFSSKRKQLWRNLSEGLKIDGGKIKELLVEIIGNEKVRAQELSVDNWVVITETLEHLNT
ncbi:MAG: ribosomal RNA small subunit methyltransferase A [Candidatus Magasanikbacteria bacterium CG_4_10_14_0_2_um_filter_37_12]|uniref:Ribosomal RNA small subunit methyltransferase A n=1 Tax=Candidatus Magasanikbacteria bacterium CG_4_10_14_0_2_um_filter_37_12 TaxID=1974637 RepID=A0A2M7V7R6_9BACT|nr:MAG: ribosomal RNA small subunit methyltransferase A [Candidatus Magasanikbacteria bacterium CG_4_10_14_0_2_um_filter_37_12]